ncbi:MAG: class I SAM-dependent methyltransferase [Flammeovirgaceae bacterium]|nr:class I SAM-dependent methyltransferase [Flammeovirgaceae bacterium]
MFHISSCGVCGFLVTRPQPAQDEIMSFYPDADYISHSSTAVTLTDYLFKIARAFTLRWKQTIISAHSQKGTLLDVGCGTGDFLFACKKSGWQITGVEPSMKAQKLAAQKTASHIHTKLEEVSGHEFNVITLWHVLEHLHDPNGTIQKLKTLLAQNGILVIALPNYESFDANKYNAYWAGFDVPRHLWHFSSSNFNKLAKNNGLNVVTTIPMKLDSYYVSLLSEKTNVEKTP